MAEPRHRIVLHILACLVVAACAEIPDESSLDTLTDALSSGRTDAQTALHDSRWRRRGLRSTRRFRDLIRDHAPIGTIRLVDAVEAGTPLTITGRVTDVAGIALPGVRLYVYQTDATGHYEPGLPPSDGERTPRLFGFVRTDRAGRYRVETIVPGAYAGVTDAVPHVHFAVHAPNYVRTNGAGPPSLYLADARTLPQEWVDEILGDGGVIRGPAPAADGIVACTYDWTLRHEPRDR